MSMSKIFDAPFSASEGITSGDIAFPITYRGKNNQLHVPKDDLQAFLQTDLLTPRLNKVHRYLWLAGLPKAARSLHRQRLIGREICATENPDEHLVWNGIRLFVKPLPEYLLRHQFWTDNLSLDQAVHKSACGLLLSYIWLIGNKNDYRIATDAGLLPEQLTWEIWTALVPGVLGHIDTRSLEHVDKRYIYGELRLTRLNSLYRLGAAGFSSFSLVHGFMAGPERYDTFFQRNFGWILALLVIVSVVLSALQVALSTDRLATDARFQSFSYAITLISLSTVATACVLVMSVWFGLFWFHLLSTLHYCKKVAAERNRGYG